MTDVKKHPQWSDRAVAVFVGGPSILCMDVWSLLMEAVEEMVITSRPKKNAIILVQRNQVNFSFNLRAGIVYKTRWCFCNVKLISEKLIGGVMKANTITML